VDAGGARHLRQPYQAVFGLLGGRHHQVGQFVHQQHDARQGRLTAAFHLFVVGQQIARVGFFQQAVAAVHFHQHPAQRGQHALELHFHPPQQVRQAVETHQLDHLGVEHDQPQIVGRVVEHQAGGQRGDAHRLTRTGGAGDEHVRHARQVCHHRLAGDVLAQGDGQGGVDLLVHRRFQDRAQPHDAAARIGHFDADERLPRHRGLDAQALGRERQRQIARQRRNLRDAHFLARYLPIGGGLLNIARLDGVLGNGRADAVAGDTSGQAKLGQRRFEQQRGIMDHGLVRALNGFLHQQVERRQLGAARARRGRVERWLFRRGSLRWQILLFFHCGHRHARLRLFLRAGHAFSPALQALKDTQRAGQEQHEQQPQQHEQQGTRKKGLQQRRQPPTNAAAIQAFARAVERYAAERREQGQCGEKRALPGQHAPQGE